MVASGQWLFLYSMNFQIRQIPTTNQNFGGGNNNLFPLSLLLCVIFEKKNIYPVWNLLPQFSKQKEIYFDTRKILQNFEGYDLHCMHITLWVISNSQSGQNNGGEIRDLMLPDVFPDTVTPDIDLTDEAIVWCAEAATGGVL